jgi:RNA polymerase sigma factor (sigma-70 family)
MIGQVQNLVSSNESLLSINTLSEKAEVVKPEMNTDSRLWEQFREGNEMAFRHIYSDYVNLLFNYGKKFSGDHELIMDCVQDFFLYLREHRDGLGPTTSIKFYLLRSFRRRLFSYITKSERENHLSHEETGFQIKLDDCGIQNFIDEEANQFMVKKLNKSLETLGNKEREAIFLYYYEEASYQEIAEIMNFSHVSSARRLIYTALGNLKETIG